MDVFTTGALEAMRKVAAVVADDIIGAGLGYHYGRMQKKRGEKHTFGVPQAAAALLIPGGLGYQVGRYAGHHAETEEKKGKEKRK